MSTSTTDGKPGHDDDMVIDTSKMSADKRDAMEVAEGAREKEDNRGFAQQLFMGTFAHRLLATFPVQSAEDRSNT